MLIDDLNDPIQRLAYRYGIRQQTVRALAAALAQSGGTSASFNLPEIGGLGTWTPDGIHYEKEVTPELRDKVNKLCQELVDILPGLSGGTPALSPDPLFPPDDKK